jgi:hypothetical protein
MLRELIKQFQHHHDRPRLIPDGSGHRFGELSAPGRIITTLMRMLLRWTRRLQGCPR